MSSSCFDTWELNGEFIYLFIDPPLIDRLLCARHSIAAEAWGSQWKATFLLTYRPSRVSVGLVAQRLLHSQPHVCALGWRKQKEISGKKGSRNQEKRTFSEIHRTWPFLSYSGTVSRGCPFLHGRRGCSGDWSGPGESDKYNYSASRSRYKGLESSWENSKST